MTTLDSPNVVYIRVFGLRSQVPLHSRRTISETIPQSSPVVGHRNPGAEGHTPLT